MTHPAVTVGPDELVKSAARLLYSLKLQRLPVVDRDGRLAGIVSRSDVLSVFGRTDEEIHREVTQDVIADGFFTDPTRFTVTVHNGIVTPEGVPGSVVLGTSIVDQVEQLEGVVAVRDRLGYPESGRSSLWPGGGTLVPGSPAGTPLPGRRAQDHDEIGQLMRPGKPGVTGSARRTSNGIEAHRGRYGWF